MRVETMIDVRVRFFNFCLTMLDSRLLTQRVGACGTSLNAEIEDLLRTHDQVPVNDSARAAPVYKTPHPGLTLPQAFRTNSHPKLSTQNQHTFSHHCHVTSRDG
jgi:hypothetical protein